MSQGTNGNKEYLRQDHQMYQLASKWGTEFTVILFYHQDHWPCWRENNIVSETEVMANLDLQWVTKKQCHYIESVF